MKMTETIFTVSILFLFGKIQILKACPSSQPELGIEDKAFDDFLDPLRSVSEAKTNEAQDILMNCFNAHRKDLSSSQLLKILQLMAKPSFIDNSDSPQKRAKEFQMVFSQSLEHALKERDIQQVEGLFGLIYGIRFWEEAFGTIEKSFASLPLNDFEFALSGSLQLLEREGTKIQKITGSLRHNRLIHAYAEAHKLGEGELETLAKTLKPITVYRFNMDPKVEHLGTYTVPTIQALSPDPGYPIFFDLYEDGLAVEGEFPGLIDAGRSLEELKIKARDERLLNEAREKCADLSCVLGTEIPEAFEPRLLDANCELLDTQKKSSFR